MEEARKALPKGKALTEAELKAAFEKQVGKRAEKVNEAVNKVKDDVAKLFESSGGKNWKYWAAIGGTALAGSLLALAFKPSSKEA